MFTQRRRILSQNFLHDRRLVQRLIGKSSIGSQDIVLEIGPGKGIITEQLLKKSNTVIAVELDRQLCFYLQNKFCNDSRLQLFNKNILQFKLPQYSYKVFANIPFSIEGKIIRKLLNTNNPPDDCYLVMRTDLAERLIGAHKENQFSLFYKPWFTFEIIHYFRKTDFSPYARMNTCMLRFIKREKPLLPVEERKQYMIFIGQGFGNGGKLKKNLNMFLSYEQLKRLGLRYHFSPNDKPSALDLKQWIGLYTSCRDGGN